MANYKRRYPKKWGGHKTCFMCKADKFLTKDRQERRHNDHVKAELSSTGLKANV